ncbi:hypothetical protein Tco_1534078 [Tanacetum coccineum]
MVEPEKPLKEKDQILMDEEIAQRLQEELQAELEEEERLARQKEEVDNLILWDNTQAMMEANYELAQRLQTEEHGELTIKERSKLFVELMDKRKNHFAKLKAEEIIRKPPTKKLFDKAMKRVNIFVDKDTELVKESFKKAEMIQKSSSKRAGNELEQEKTKKQKIDDDEVEMKKYMEVVPINDVAIDAISLATKPPVIVDWKIIKEGKIRYFQIIRADGSSKRYSSMIRMLQDIDIEDLETLWKLVKAKHGNTRPEEAYERVL